MESEQACIGLLLFLWFGTVAWYRRTVEQADNYVEHLEGKIEHLEEQIEGMEKELSQDIAAQKELLKHTVNQAIDQAFDYVEKGC